MNVQSIPVLSTPLIEKFWSKVAITANINKCWEWQAFKNKEGYGGFRVNRNQVIASHRLAYFIHNNKDPLDKCVCHSCDNPACVNPAHLWLGTRYENAMDRESKGRNKPLSGEKNGNSRFTAEQVKEMRALYSSGELNQHEIAERFGTHQGVIWAIVTKKTWKHI